KLSNLLLAITQIIERSCNRTDRIVNAPLTIDEEDLRVLEAEHQAFALDLRSFAATSSQALQRGIIHLILRIHHRLGFGASQSSGISRPSIHQAVNNPASSSGKSSSNCAASHGKQRTVNSPLNRSIRSNATGSASAASNSSPMRSCKRSKRSARSWSPEPA